MVRPGCRISLGKYDGILEIIRLGIIEAGQSPEEFTAFFERHARVLKELEITGRITRRVKGTGPNGLLSEAEKTALKDACAAFGAAWKMSYPNRALTPKGHVVVVHVPWFVDKNGICGVLGEDGGEAVRFTDSAARRQVRQMKNPEARHKVHTLHHTARIFTPLLKRVILPRAKRPRPDCAAACAFLLVTGAQNSFGLSLGCFGRLVFRTLVSDVCGTDFFFKKAENSIPQTLFSPRNRH
jgi:hypothetical protein